MEKVNQQPPAELRPLLWSLHWEDVDVEKDKHDIILNVINEGSLMHWRWLAETYGAGAIREAMAQRLETEFHPESYRLAKIMFGLPQLRHVRRRLN